MNYIKVMSRYISMNLVKKKERTLTETTTKLLSHAMHFIIFHVPLLREDTLNALPNLYFEIQT